MKDIIPYKTEKPMLQVNWDYEESVAKVKPVLGRWKSEAKETIIPELWHAHEHSRNRQEANLLQYRGENILPSTNWTFSDYCEDIGITRQTGRNWLIDAGLLQSGAHISNNTGNQENYTPRDIIDAVKQVMGGISLDPASCDKAQEIIEAEEYFTEEDNGLDKEWYGNVFLNPPYQQPQIRQFTDKLIEQRPNFDSAILLTNNNTDTRWFHKCAVEASAICFTKGRIHFYTKETEETQPTNGQTFFYYGDDIDKFVAIFKNVGIIVRIYND